MHFDSIRIRNYRSISDLTISPRPLTVLVGANNAGKSNISDAFEFLGDCYRVNPQWAVDQRGGFDQVVFRLKEVAKNRTIQFDISLRLSFEEILEDIERSKIFGLSRPDEESEQVDRFDLLIEHSFTLKPVRPSKVKKGILHENRMLAPGLIISQEHITITKQKDTETVSQLELEFAGNVSVKVHGDRTILDLFWWSSSIDKNDEKLEFLHVFLDPTPLRPSLALHRVLYLLKNRTIIPEQLSFVRSYQPETHACRKPSSPKEFVLLEKNGDELPALVATLKDHSTAGIFEQLVTRMKTMVPNLRTLNIRETDDQQWVIDFIEQNPPRTWKSSQMSDGTMRALALYSILFQPRGILTVIEEPENTLHPWVIREFIDACREHHMSRSIVLTSHSPALIDLLEPSEVAVVWKEDGRTKLSPLLDLIPSAQKSWSEGRSTLYEILDSGIVPQSVPGESL